MPRSWTALLVGSALVGCSGGEGSGDSDVTTCAQAPTVSCCEHDCDNDVAGSPSCVNGAWVCPPDYVSSTYCPTHRFCQGPLPGSCDAGTGNPCDDNPGFVCCVAGCTNHVTTSPFCDASGWHCPAGTVSPEDCPGQAFCL